MLSDLCKMKGEEKNEIKDKLISKWKKHSLINSKMESEDQRE
jgi:hypothetical protein